VAGKEKAGDKTIRICGNGTSMGAVVCGKHYPLVQLSDALTGIIGMYKTKEVEKGDEPNAAASRVTFRDATRRMIEDLNKAAAAAEVDGTGKPSAGWVPPAFPPETITYTRYISVVQEAVLQCPEEFIVVPDECSSMYSSQAIIIPAKGGFSSQAIWGSIGYAASAAQGIHYGSNKRPLILSGDGGFHMTCTHLAAMKLSNTPAIVIVVSNQIYAIEQSFVDMNAFIGNQSTNPEDVSKTHYKAPALYDQLPLFDYVALAKGMGVTGMLAKTMSEFKGMFEKARGHTSGPVLLALQVPPTEQCPQMRALASDANTSA
jgi:thiamine pyrophosphate-dependent acetolactate synthase large subunit-like protein